MDAKNVTLWEQVLRLSQFLIFHDLDFQSIVLTCLKYVLRRECHENENDNYSSLFQLSRVSLSHQIKEGHLF